MRMGNAAHASKKAPDCAYFQARIGQSYLIFEQFILTNSALGSTVSFPRNSRSFHVFRRATHDDAADLGTLLLKAVCSNPRHKRDESVPECSTSG
jgi:hypothetical protein